MTIIEVSGKEVKQNVSLKQRIEKLFYNMSEEDRKNVWSDGNCYCFGDKFYLACPVKDGFVVEQKLQGVLYTTGTVIASKSNLVASQAVELLTLFVDPEYRRNHVATCLVERAMRKSKHRVVMVKIKKNNLASLELFKNLGFEELNNKLWEWIATPNHIILTAEKS